MKFTLPFRKAAKTVLVGSTVAAITFSGFVLNERSQRILEPLSYNLQEVTRCAATKPMFTLDGKTITFVAYHGYRTELEHRSMIERGVTWVNRSRHQDGKAVDVMAVINGKGTWEPDPYYELAKAFYACGKEKGVPITWGGEWRVKDFVHFEEKTR